MKNLLLIRHAKSSWDEPGLEDRERPLSDRGIKDVPQMANVLKNYNINFDRILCSGAMRARMTIEIMNETLKLDSQKIVFMDELYNASRRDILDLLKQLDDELMTVAIVGHNPGLTDLANFLLYDFEYELPTCGMVFIELDVNKWSELKSGTGILKFYEYPKKHKP
ncbi:MAG: phosphohistidine phosphatase SixA [Ignavibacteria bacterium]